MERKSGVLLHISSLWSEYSCGSFGKAAFQFIDFLKECGFTYWQVLPFNLPDDYNSPYSSFSAFSVNPYFIDLEELYNVGLLTKDELEEAKQDSPYVCEFERLKKERLPLLEKAAERFQGGKLIDEFFDNHSHTLSFCHYMARKKMNDGKAFWLWDNDEEDETTLKTWKFICYVFFLQWKKVKSCATSKGISIIGDIPMYVAQDSSDIWECPELFLLNEQRRPLCVAGVPPDYFSKEGQLWGNPIYNWEKMKETNYKWWKERMAFTSEFFDCIRFDHFRGFEAYYTCPPDAKNAIVGEWHKGPGIEFINDIKKACPNTKFIAEDLGVMTDEVKKLVEDSGFPGMRVLQFANPDEPDNYQLPHNYIKNCVAYIGTHDNTTLLDHIWSLDQAQRMKFLAYCGYDGYNWDSKDSYYSVIRTLLGSVADTVIFQLQDLLLYGKDTRMNVPGVAKGNWAWRLKYAQLNTIDKNKLKFLNKLYSRV